MNYLFDTERISQHIVKFGLNLQPPLSLKDDKSALQDYANWLTENLPAAFDTLLLSPTQLRVDKSFAIAGSKKATVPTFVVTTQGPLWTLPIRLFIDQRCDIDLPEPHKLFTRAFTELQNRLSRRNITAVELTDEFIFDTGRINSVKILAGTLKDEHLTQQLRNLTIRLERPLQQYAMALEFRPTYLRRAGPTGPVQNLAFGIAVRLTLGYSRPGPTLTAGQIHELLTFGQQFVPEQLIEFLNGQIQL